jgi:hypothetical protein
MRSGMVLGAIAVITVVMTALWYRDQVNTIREMDRIFAIESDLKERRETLAHVRENTIACPISGLDDPRSCFLQSDFKCRWHREAERCNLD